jgi:hypothetical protein
MATQVTLNSGSVDSAGSLALKTNGTTTAVTIDTSQNVGIGVTPSAWGAGSQAFQNGGGALFQYNNDRIFLGQNSYIDSSFADRYIGNGWATRYRQYQGTHSFYISTVSNSSGAGASQSFTQAMTLDASGNLRLGTTGSSDARLYARGAGTTSATASFEAANSSGATRLFVQDDGTTRFFGSAGSETARITSGGELLVGTTSATSGSRLRVQTSGTTSGTWGIYIENSASTRMFAILDSGTFYTGTATTSPYNNTTGSGANMVVTSDGVLYRSTSSIKYKTDVQDATHGLDEVLQLRSVTYKGKAEADAGKTFGGLIAEEVHAAGLTEFVQYAEDGSPDALNYGNMVSLCIKAIQEQQALITQLQADVAALKGASA